MPEPSVFMVFNGYAPNYPDVFFTAVSLRKLGFKVLVVGSARQGRDAIPTQQIKEEIPFITLPHYTRITLSGLVKLLMGRLEATVQPNNVTITTMVTMLLFNLWVLRLGLRQQCAVVHCHDLSPLPACWLLAWLKGAKLVYHLREDFPSRKGGRTGQLLERMERFLLRRCDAVISTGTFLQKLLLERGAKEVTLIGNWKRREDFAIPDEVVAERRAALNLRPDERLIVYVGTLDPARELLPLVEAVAARPDIRLLIGGRGLLQDEIQALAERAPNIHWLGWVPMADVPLYSKMADCLYWVLALGEFQEQNERCPAGHKVFEAYTAGVPIILRAGINEASDDVAQNGAGILIEDASRDSLFRAFDLLHDDEQMRLMRARAREQGERYNWEEAERRLKQIYERLLTLPAQNAAESASPAREG